MSDLIDRQAAIKAMKAARVEDDGTYNWRTQRNLDLEFAAELLETIPPVQPEIVPCDYVKACKEATRNSPIDVYVYRNALAELKELGYVLVDMREVTT